MSWTEEKVKKLKELWGKGSTASQIAQIIGGGVSRNAVIGKAHRLSLSGKTNNSSIAGGVSSKRNNEKFENRLKNRFFDILGHFGGQNDVIMAKFGEIDQIIFSLKVPKNNFSQVYGQKFCQKCH